MSDEKSDNNKEAEVVSLRPVDQISMDFIRGDDEESKRLEQERKAKNASIIKDTNVSSINAETLTPAILVQSIDWSRTKDMFGIVFDENDKPVVLMSAMGPKDLAYASAILKQIADSYLFGGEL
jgi:hypothetical protein